MEINVERVGIEKKFYDLTKGIIESLGLELYDLQYVSGSSTLKLFIKDPETDTAVIEDCVRVDKALTDLIETEEWMPENLILEVSSPGIFRDLRSKEHFESARDQNIELHLSKKLDSEELPKKWKGQKKVQCVLTGVDNDSIDISLDNHSLKIFYADIKRANLNPDI